MNRLNRPVHKTLALFFGEKWITRQLDKAKVDGYHNLNPMNLAALNHHPLIRAIIETQSKLESSARNGKSPIHLGRSEVTQILLHENLTAIEPDFDLADIQIRLRNKDEFPKVEYEIAVGAGYKRAGCHVKPLPRTQGKRTAEFHIEDNSGNVVVVECKKKDMTPASQEQISGWWELFQHTMMQSLKAEQMNYGISIYIPLNPTREDINKVIGEVITQIKSGAEGEIYLFDNEYRVVIEKFSDTGQVTEYDRVVNFASASDFGVSSMSQEKKYWPNGSAMPVNVHAAKKVCAYGPSDFLDERVDGVLSTIKSAYGQLEDDKPNVVYIDYNLALMREDRSKELLSRLSVAISKKLNKDYSKVSAVVLTNLKVVPHPSAIGYYALEEVIHNPNAIIPVPSEFPLYGDAANGVSILADVNDILKRQ